MEIVAFASAVFAVISTLTSAVFVARSTIKDQTIKSQGELISTLKSGQDERGNQLKELQQQHMDTATSMASMQGQIETLKTIPLNEISKGMSSLAETQKAIFELLLDGTSKRPGWLQRRIDTNGGGWNEPGTIEH